MSLKSKTGAVLTKAQIGITHSTIGATLVSNCNSATDVNVEYYTNNATENKPTDTGTYLVWCHKINSSTMTQFATLKASTSALYMRQYNGSWSDWVIVTRPLDVYPVGSIYKSNTSTNPAQYFGGTWTRVSAWETLSVSGAVVDSPTSDPTGKIYMRMHTKAQIQSLFNSKYGFTPTLVETQGNDTYTDLGIMYSNGQWEARNSTVYGGFHNTSNEDAFYALVSDAGRQRIDFTYITHRSVYTFVRSA